jgi:uroporphyrinogen decarboxylase
MLSPADYQEFSWKYINQIVEALSPLTHVVVFGKGCWFALEDMTMSKVSALVLTGRLLLNLQEL